MEVLDQDPTATHAPDTEALTPAPTPTYDPAFPLARLRESPHNPRKTFGDLAELAQSIREQNILSPLLVRPLSDDLDAVHEIVFGHRRYRAAVLAGLETAPVTIRALSDRDASEMQIVENSQREDLHPLEEADGYRLLHDEFHYTVESLAAKIGKSPSYVYGRLKLAQLGPEAREGYASGKYQLAVALTLAQLTDPKLQAAAAKEVSAPKWEGAAPWTTADARGHILRKYMLRLESAPFAVDDAQLVPAAGSCLACPKNTGRQVALFPAEPTEALCTDGACFEGKRLAAWTKREADAAKHGERVMSEAEMKVLTGGQGNHLNLYNSPYVRLTESSMDDPKRRKYAELLAGQKFPLVLARTPDAVVHELIEKKLLPKLLKAAGHDFDKLEREMEAKREAAAASSTTKAKGGKPAVDPEKAYREAEKKRKAAAALDEEVELAQVRATRDAVLARPAVAGEDRALWQWIARMLALQNSYSCALFVTLRDLEAPKGKHMSPVELVLEEASSLAASGCKGLVAELLFACTMDNRDEGAIAEMERFLKIKFDAIEKSVREKASKPVAVEPRGKGPSKPVAKPAASKASGKSATPAAKKPTPKAPAKKASKKPGAK